MMKSKSDYRCLSILGGEPVFQEKFHVGRPNIGDRQKLSDRITDILDRQWFTNNGPYVQEFEKRIANLVGVKHCIAVCNATIGLEIAIRALQLDGEVIIPSFTFVATSHALQWQGITPVFCDIDPQTHNIDSYKIRQLITPRTTGIIGVHLWGRSCNIDALSDIALEYGLRLLFDAAHAFGCSYNGEMIGGFGDVEVFSFHATKFLNSFEGGAIVTNSDDLATKIRLMKNFGFAGYDNVIYVGTNGKMSEVSAAMGITSLESLEDFVETNYHNYKEYQEGLKDIPGVLLSKYDERNRNNYQYIILEIEAKEFGLTRDQVLKILHAENILARRYFYPGCHRMEPYRSYFPNAGLLLPETERLSERILALPTGTSINSSQIEIICEIIQMLSKDNEKIKELLKSDF